MTGSKEIFSFHLAKLPLSKLPRFFLQSSRNLGFPGLNHSESFFTMNLGESVIAPHRYNLTTVAFFAWWSDEKYLSEFLSVPNRQFFSDGWHVRMKLYRRWGGVAELNEASLNHEPPSHNMPIVAVTLARLKLLEAARFVKWGRPVENQVRSHAGKRFALAAMRPPNTFSTFSIWSNEAEMVGMVNGRTQDSDNSHQLAMQERVRRDFHYEFTTLRFAPLKEYGSWNGKSIFLT